MRTVFTINTAHNRVLRAVLRAKYRLSFWRLVVKATCLNRILRLGRQFSFSLDRVTLGGVEWEFVTHRYIEASVEGNPKRPPWLLRLARISSTFSDGSAEFERLEDCPYKSGIYHLRTADAQVAYRHVTREGRRIYRFELFASNGTLPDRAELCKNILAGRAPSRRLLNWPIKEFERGYRHYTLEELQRAAEAEEVTLPGGRELAPQDYVDALVDARWDKWEVEEARMKAGRTTA